MSEHDVMQKLASAVAEMSDQMSAEQLRLYSEMVTRKFEAKVAEEAFMAAANLESAGDVRKSETLRAVRKTLEDGACRLSGSECVMLACYHKMLEGEDDLDTRRLNIFLHSYDRKPSNSTKIVELMARKGWMETRSEALHAHKTFALTPEGVAHAEELLARFKHADGGERLSLVK